MLVLATPPAWLPLVWGGTVGVAYGLGKIHESRRTRRLQTQKFAVLLKTMEAMEVELEVRELFAGRAPPIAIDPARLN